MTNDDFVPPHLARQAIDKAIVTLSEKVCETADGELTADLAALVSAAASYGGVALKARQWANGRRDRESTPAVG